MGPASFSQNLFIFLKSQATAILATIIDFSVLIFLVEFFSCPHLVAVAFGALCGGLANFWTNRQWAFRSQGAWGDEGIRYILVSGASIALNVLLVHLGLKYIGLQYINAKIIAAIAVGFFWNFPLHRFWVFKNRNQNA